MAEGSVLTGKTGSITYGAVPTTVRIINFSVKKSSSPVPVSDGGSGDFEEFLPGKRVNWSGSFEKFLRSGQTEIPFNEVLTFKGIVETGVEIAGSIIVNDRNVVVDTNNNEATKFTYSFQGTGTLTDDWVLS